MIVKDIMHMGIHLVKGNSSVQSVARIMAELNIGAVLVGSPESLEGIFSERDLMFKVVAPGLSIENTPVSEVMTRKVLTVEETEAFNEVLFKMEKNRIRHLPVLNKEGVCTGMLGARDLMGAMINSLENENKIMSNYILTVSLTAIAILDLAEEFGVKSGNSIVIDHDLSKSKIEDLTDSSVKALDKVLANFADEGLISFSDNKLVILDIKKLENKII